MIIVNKNMALCDSEVAEISETIIGDEDVNESENEKTINTSVNVKTL